MITASPQLTYSSVLSTIRLYEVTSGKLENSTFVQWTAHFSSDADAGMLLSPNGPAGLPFTKLVIGVIQDAKFKRREALADLAKAAASL